MEPFDTSNTVVLRELDKIMRRFDSLEDKVNAMYAVNERIRKEASFRRTYRDVPLYSAVDHDNIGNMVVADDDEDESVEDEEEEEGMVIRDTPTKRNCFTQMSGCCIIAWTTNRLQ